MNCKQCGEKYPSPQWRYCPSCGAVNEDVMKNVNPANDPIDDEDEDSCPHCEGNEQTGVVLEDGSVTVVEDK